MTKWHLRGLKCQREMSHERARARPVTLMLTQNTQGWMFTLKVRRSRARVDELSPPSVTTAGRNVWSECFLPHHWKPSTFFRYEGSAESNGSRLSVLEIGSQGKSSFIYLVASFPNSSFFSTVIVFFVEILHRYLGDRSIYFPSIFIMDRLKSKQTLTNLTEN